MSEKPPDEEVAKPAPGKLRQNLLPLIAIVLSVILSAVSIGTAEWRIRSSLTEIKAQIQKPAEKEKGNAEIKSILASITNLEQELQKTNALTKEQGALLSEAKADIARLAREIAKPALARPALSAPTVSGAERYRARSDRNNEKGSGKGGFISDGKSPWE